MEGVAEAGAGDRASAYLIFHAVIQAEFVLFVRLAGPDNLADQFLNLGMNQIRIAVLMTLNPVWKAASVKESKAAFTKDTVITVVADEDCTAPAYPLNV